MTWGAFNVAVRVFLHEYNRMLGVQSLIDACIKGALLDLQNVIPELKASVSSVFLPVDTTKDGYSSRVSIEPGSMVTDLVIRKTSTPDESLPFTVVQAGQVGDLDLGNTSADQVVVSYDPRAGVIVIAPDLETLEAELVVFTEVDGPPTSDNTETPLGDNEVEVVSDYVLSKLARSVERDPGLSKSYSDSYTKGKRLLVSEWSEKRRLPARNRKFQLVSGNTPRTTV